MNRSLDPTAALAVLCGASISSSDSAGCGSLLGEIKKLRGWLDAVEARVTSRMTELHDTAGAAPASDLHTKCGGVTADEGRRKERRSKTLDEAPGFGDALAHGEVTSGHVDALANATAKLDDAVKEKVLDRLDDLLSDAKSMSPEKFGQSCRDLARHFERDQGIERNRRQRRDTYLSRKLNPSSGMIEGRFSLHPELGNQIFGAIDKHVGAMIKRGEADGDPAFAGRTPDRNQLSAEAWGELLAGGHQAIRPAEADITLIIDHDTAACGTLSSTSVCETSDGAPVPPASVRRLMCSGRIIPIILDPHGNPLNVGRTVRNANRAQRRALRCMYRTCAFGDCDVTFDRCEMHHVVWYRYDGTTDLDNLVPLCSRHHYVVHEDGWQLILDPDRTLTIEQPDGTVYAECEPDIPPPDGTDRHATRRQRQRRRRPTAA